MLHLEPVSDIASCRANVQDKTRLQNQLTTSGACKFHIHRAYIIYDDTGPVPYLILFIANYYN